MLDDFLSSHAQNITKDLHVTNSEYNTSLALYFIAYVLFEVPANVSYR